MSLLAGGKKKQAWIIDEDYKKEAAKNKQKRASNLPSSIKKTGLDNSSSI